MNVKQAALRWEVSEKTAKKICSHMQIDPGNIPEDLVPVYPADRYYDDPHRLYLVILDVISNTHLDLEGIDQETLETCLTQLREEDLIVAKNGRSSDSSDYHDYIISMNRDRFYRWHNCKTKSGISLLKKLLALIGRILR